MAKPRAGLSCPGGGSVCNRHDFMEGPPTVFHVRQKGYAKERKKAPSEAPLYTPFACDMLSFDAKQSHIAEVIDLPELPEDMQSAVNGVPPMLIINVMLPKYDPPNPVWGHTKTDGPNWSFVFYTVMTKETQAALLDLSNASPAVQLLHDFMQDDSQEMRERFKMMVSAFNPGDMDVGGVVKKLLNDYNMKPLLTRPQHFFHTDGQTYFEVDIDVNQFGYVARKAFGSMRDKLGQLRTDLGFTIEARNEEELPECMLTILYIHKKDLKDAWSLAKLQEETDKAIEEEEAESQSSR